MNRYPIRVAKYIVYLSVLFLIIFSFMNAVGGTKVPLDTMFTSSRGLWMFVVVFVFALLYPFFGFVKKTLTFDAAQRVEDTERVMLMCGYKRISGEADALVFRADSSMKRLLLMYEDTITITTVDGLTTMAGPRKEVVKASFRMTTFVL